MFLGLGRRAQGSEPTLSVTRHRVARPRIRSGAAPVGAALRVSDAFSDQLGPGGGGGNVTIRLSNMANPAPAPANCTDEMPETCTQRFSPKAPGWDVSAAIR